MFALLGSSLFKTLAPYIIAVLAVLAIAGAGAAIDHKFMVAHELREKLAAEQAAMAKQKAIDKLEQDASNAELQKQQALAEGLSGQLAFLRAHPVRIPCVPLGLVRVLDATVLNIPAGTLNLPPGASDATCSKVTAAYLARSIISNYAASGANAEQLEALQNWAKALEKIR